MNIDRLLSFLIEEEVSELDGKARAFTDRLLLRFMTSPALMAFFDAVQVEKEGDAYTLELIFRQVPDSQVKSIRDLIAVPVEARKFVKDGHTLYGFKVDLNSEAFEEPNAGGLGQSK